MARSALGIAESCLVEFSKHLPAGTAPIQVVICADVAEFRRRAGVFGRPDVGGVARPDEGVIILKAPRLLEPPADFAGVLRHELAHVLLARNTDTERMPRWLNEGIAMILSKENRWNSIYRVAQMQLQGRIIPYRDLLFYLREPGDEESFGDAYAQSLLMTQYLMSMMSEESFWAMVRAQREMSFGDALRHYAGQSPPHFFSAWRSSLWKYSVVFWAVSGFGLFQLMAVLVLLAYIRKRRVEAAILARWDEEEAEESDVEMICHSSENDMYQDDSDKGSL